MSFRLVTTAASRISTRRGGTPPHKRISAATTVKNPEQARQREKTSRQPQKLEGELGGIDWSREQPVKETERDLELRKTGEGDGARSELAKAEEEIGASNLDEGHKDRRIGKRWRRLELRAIGGGDGDGRSEIRAHKGGGGDRSLQSRRRPTEIARFVSSGRDRPSSKRGREMAAGRSQ
ncbi:hypothetical protein TIFTF001_037316 [Ficus carica]|uniref:Uncharacterized protein n=1 Tax=Ficus carica TaxID=3494 RepID=A0AA88E5C0_FICCA|nr:hypothetical protein TIFTF001_037316 [Ficus carica]